MTNNVSHDATKMTNQLLKKTAIIGGFFKYTALKQLFFRKSNSSIKTLIKMN